MFSLLASRGGERVDNPMEDPHQNSTMTFHDADEDNGEVVDTPEKCRERRKRRIETRRWRLCRGRSSLDKAVDPAEELFRSPEFGMMSVAGRMREMEDAVCVCTDLCRPVISRRLPVHFFAVYDGHGGPHVAALCKKRLHVFLQEELMRVGLAEERENWGGVVAEEELQGWTVALRRAFERMDEMVINTSCSCGVGGYGCGCHPFAVALGGSTATVAVITPHHIVVANCGDSRAVLCRGRQTLPLSLDHKQPDRPDELARIEAAGGRVINLKGARVQGILAMSRAIGDKFLKPLVISEPEITITRRDPEDECLILASDGLWDVMSSELACKVASECLREGKDVTSPEKMGDDDEGPNLMHPSQSTIAAALLTRLALGRDSSDNISVIVVDLKSRR